MILLVADVLWKVKEMSGGGVDLEPDAESSTESETFVGAKLTQQSSTEFLNRQ